MSKLFVRERRSAGRGTGNPRFALVGTSGVDLKIYHSHLRKVELEKIAAELNAEIVYLPRGEKSEEDQRAGRRGRRRKADPED